MVTYSVIRTVVIYWGIVAIILATSAIILDCLSPKLQDKFKTKKRLLFEEEMRKQGCILLEPFPGGMLGFIATLWVAIPSAIIFFVIMIRYALLPFLKNIAGQM